MAATLAAARGAYPGRRILLAFQPHRYTRTRDCFEDFVKVMGSADAVLLAEVYAAGEAPIVAADGRSLARALRVAGRVDPVFVDEIGAMAQAIVEQAQPGDVVISMGAGPIGSPGAGVGALAEIGMSTSSTASLGKVAVLTGGTSAEREISILSGPGVLAALVAASVDAPFRSGQARSRRSEEERLRPLLRRPARPPRRGRQRPGSSCATSLHRAGDVGLTDPLRPRPPGFSRMNQSVPIGLDLGGEGECM